MITIAGGDGYGTFLVGTDGSPPLRLRDWKMDRYETGNRQYKAFLDAGGYRDSTYWDQPFRHDGRALPRAEAMAQFIDQHRPAGARHLGGRWLSRRPGRHAGGRRELVRGRRVREVGRQVTADDLPLGAPLPASTCRA